jgi:hypothetical protein
MSITTAPLLVEGKPPSLNEVFGHDCIVLILYIQFALVSSQKKYIIQTWRHKHISMNEMVMSLTNMFSVDVSEAIVCTCSSEVSYAIFKQE